MDGEEGYGRREERIAEGNEFVIENTKFKERNMEFIPGTSSSLSENWLYFWLGAGSVLVIYLLLDRRK